ncbi:hypothetical protein [Motiliproteus sp. MSK22-1]|uniref:hypothetical protein n=1 Tax=Motiliproteus sp. MSK22-1 TaxID=1897630 RepID=UPI000977A8DD|nr:hypothetical protein [Motiliproteus sp. MSK22-1]OMH33620.1 hypothetical protein BGP75_11405 [Motiliproteus sp. MSK22-1]
MKLSKSQLKQQAVQVQYASIKARLARQRMQTAVEETVASPRGLISGFALGFVYGRRLQSKDCRQPGSVTRLISYLPLLLRLL